MYVTFVVTILPRCIGFKVGGGQSHSDDFTDSDTLQDTKSQSMMASNSDVMRVIQN